MPDPKATAAKAEREPAPGAAKAKAAAEKAVKAKPMPALRILGPQGGFWRAGRRWGAEPVDVPVDALTRAQIEQLKAEPKLTVVEIEIELPTD